MYSGFSKQKPKVFFGNHGAKQLLRLKKTKVFFGNHGSNKYIRFFSNKNLDETEGGFNENGGFRVKRVESREHTAVDKQCCDHTPSQCHPGSFQKKILDDCAATLSHMLRPR